MPPPIRNRSPDSGYDSLSSNSTSISFARNTENSGLRGLITRKRKSLSTAHDNEDDGDDRPTKAAAYDSFETLTSAQDDGEHVGAPARILPATAFNRNKTTTIAIEPPPLVYPKSVYKGYSPPLPKRKEVEALQQFEKWRPSNDDDDDEKENGDGCIYYLFDGFRAYNPEGHSRFGQEMLPLSVFNVGRGSTTVFMDGVLKDETGKMLHVEGILVDRISVDHERQMGHPRVWVQSVQNSVQRLPGTRGYVKDATKIWYVLGRPAEEYERYHQPFLWLAGFGRYFVSYVETTLEEATGEWRDVTLELFRRDFANWCGLQYGSDPYFRQWKKEYNDQTDFRAAVAVHKEWLWNQAFGVSEPQGPMMKLKLWDEVLHLNAIPAVKEEPIEETIVTPYVYECFHPLFTNLRVVHPQGTEPGERRERSASRQRRNSKLEVVIESPAQASDPKAKKPKTERSFRGGFEYSNPKVGDAVAIEMDKDTKWKAGAEEKLPLWFGYVSKVSAGGEQLSVVWLYKPSETILHSQSGKYPHDNELFFSDHCNCESDAPLLSKDVVRVISVSFFGNPESKTEYFVRQLYQTEDPGFITLQESHLEACPCEKKDPHPYFDARAKYDAGDTILILAQDDTLEPVAIQQFHHDSLAISVRRLERRDLVERDVPPNELVYTHTFITLSPKRIVRPCHVRVFLSGEPIHAPYDRNGCGDCFYVTRESANGITVPLTDHPSEKKLRQGLNLETEKMPRPKLQGMDLFCGGGNFGRGLEEGGAVQMKWAVDMEGASLHSYRANLKDVNDTALYLGSINNYLNSAILGKDSSLIPRPGEVQFISAGSPCQGFSLANGQRNSERSIQNCSLVSSFATAIDFYRPKYALLENVHQIAQTRQLGDRECNVFSCMLNCLVGMGYQCQQFILDSWSHGNCQSRTRLFLAVSAPDEKVLKRPPRSHQHPPFQKALGLYRAPNGEKFGRREMEGPCPFPHRSPAQDYAHLPNIHENHVGICIPYPDHRVSRTEASGTRLMMQMIPRFPAQEGWRSAVVRGRMHPSIQRYKNEQEKGSLASNSWRRISGDRLVRTITTTLTPQCARTGTWVHFKEPRLLTVQETRIAQGFPDNEVLVGEAAKQFKVVGNSVARGVSVAMGLALRRAYFGMQE